MPTSGPTVAVVGSGISGLTAAYLLRHTHRVVLLEAQDRLGGHTHTHQVRTPEGDQVGVDSGFIVHNDRTYPLLRRLFAELGVQARRTEMSMSIRDEASGLEYAGGRGPKGVLAQRRRAVSPGFLAVLVQVSRFHRQATRFQHDGDDTLTLGEFLRSRGFSDAFVRLYAVPLVACVWSTGTARALDYPARYLFRFLDHHGMLSISGSPQWYTVTGGSSTYVARVREELERCGGRVDAGARTVTRHADGVSVRLADDRSLEVDKVVLAAHADESLALLTDPTPAEKEVLGAFGYSRNEAVLHTDDSWLPRARGARSSWNYRIPAGDTVGDEPMVSYWMNRLQGLTSATNYLVTLNPGQAINPDRVLARMTYMHPVYDRACVTAQARLPELVTPRTGYAGAYHGWGFHEDGARSGVGAAASFGVTW
ncbi:MAG: FAD-dependent oxidoreductase [Actinomycetota bacterium]|nr:FAD-dependent oxidoreductase [Actinomycetota bacterium]